MHAFFYGSNKPMALHLHISDLVSMPRCFRLLVCAFLLFISTTLVVQAASDSVARNSTTNTTLLNASKKFIRNQCNSTATYPNVCYNSLSPYASKIKTNRLILTRVSVLLALKAARASSRVMTRLSKLNTLTHDETLVVADCGENIDDTVDLLEQSADGILHLNGTRTNEDRFQWDDIKTWMSAAITDDYTCTDEFHEMEVRPSVQKMIKTSVDYAEWMTSNALAFVNRLAY